MELKEKIEKFICSKMGVSGKKDILAWFSKSRKDGYTLPGLAEAKKYIDKHKNGSITIVGDYDPDGQFATHILEAALKKYGCQNVSVEIPHPFTDGYGINAAIIDRIKQKGLILTCDNGIAAIEAVSYAKSEGFDVVVTDHHEPAYEKNRPVKNPADVVIDLKAHNPGKVFDGYCGAGIAYKLAAYLLPDDFRLRRELEVFAGIATVCDCVPLIEENFVFVFETLARINRSLEGSEHSEINAGLFALLNMNRINHLDAEKIGFSIGPVLNAKRRLCENENGAMTALALLDATQYDAAIELANDLRYYNDKRKALVREAFAEAEKNAEKYKEDNILVVYLPNVKKGIVGIVASKLAEKYAVPCICLTEDTDQQYLCGSARSVEAVDIKAALDKIHPFLLKFGGHKGAAGLTLHRSNLESVRTHLNEIMNEIGFAKSANKVEFDIEIDAAEIGDALEAQSAFEPFGMNNPKPVFHIKNFRVVPSYGKYVKALASDGIKLENINGITAVGFGLDTDITENSSPRIVDIVGTLSYNWYGARSIKEAKPQVSITSIRDVTEPLSVGPLAEKIAREKKKN